MRGVPAYKKVVNHLNGLVQRQGWIPALDGGRLHVRSEHKALNTSLQSAGALVAKQWACGIEDSLIDSGWNHGWDGDFVFLGYYHDEIQVAVRAPNVRPETYFNPTDYASWTLESAKAEDEKDLLKKIEKHQSKHKQAWFWEQSPEIQHIGKTVKSVIKEVESHFDFRCPLDCEYIVGHNWADCH